MAVWVTTSTLGPGEAMATRWIVATESRSAAVDMRSNAPRLTEGDRLGYGRDAVGRLVCITGPPESGDEAPKEEQQNGVRP